MAETYNEKYFALLARPVPSEGLILPRSIAELVQAITKKEQPTNEYQLLFERFSRAADKKW